MNKRIRIMIDEIFAEMKMTPENLALRDELMANAQARYEDAVAQGRTEEEAFAEVASSLGDVQSLLSEMNAAPEAEKTESCEQAEQPEQTQPEQTQPEQTQPEQETAGPEQAAESGAQESFDLENTLNRAFAALGDFGRSVMPQAKKLVKDVDQATGGMIRDVGRAVNRGMRDAQKAAGEAIDRRNRAAQDDAQTADWTPAQETAGANSRSAESLRNEAADLRAQAALKEASGDAENARAMIEKAEALEAQAESASQAEAASQEETAAQEAAMEEARRLAEQAAAADAPLEQGEEGESSLKRAVEDVVRDVDGAVDSFTREAEKLAEEARRIAGEGTPLHRGPQDNGTPVENVCLTRRFPVAGLRSIDIQLDADDVLIEPADGLEIEVRWEAEKALSVPDVRMESHALVIRRTNPDVFKTFFSVFKKDGGRIVVRVPRGYAADYAVKTTSGDIVMRDVDADDVTVGSTSGDVRVEPEAAVRARKIGVNTVSGNATVSARAEEIEVNTVSGRQFISCDAGKADINAVSGSVHLEGACDEWEANSVSGEIELLCTLVPARKIELSTISGGVRVALPGDIRGFVADISGMSGSIVNEFGPNRYGTCALPIHMNTMSGRLTITRL